MSVLAYNSYYTSVFSLLHHDSDYDNEHKNDAKEEDANNY